MANTKKKNEEIEEKTIDLSDIQKQMDEMMKLITQKDNEIESLKAEINKKSSSTSIMDEDKWVTIKSVVKGTLTVKTNQNEYVFKEEGQTEEVKFSEIRSLKNSKPSYFTTPLFVIVDDEDVVKRLGLTRQYEEMAFLNDLPTFFNTRDEKQVIEALNKLPRFTLLQVFNTLKELYNSKQFIDVDVRNLINSKYAFDIFE